MIESLNNNEIVLELNLDNLQKALKSGQYSHETLMKLIKKNNCAYLSFAIEMNHAQSITVIQDVPVAVMSSQQYKGFVEPKFPNPSIYILMPPLKVLRPIIERMKNLEQFLYITANMNGELTFKVETEMFTIGTFFRGLEHPQLEGMPPPSPDVTKQARVKVEAKKFYKSLYSHQILPKSVICCLFEKQALVLHVILEDLVISYYVPVVSDDDD